MTLAVDSYRHIPDLVDNPQVLNLSWTLDERQFLSSNVTQLIATCLADEIDSGLRRIGQYLVKDPYGTAMLGDAVSAYFDSDGLASQVSCAAGVNAWLQSLSALAGAGPVLVAEGSYPDFPHWARVAGTKILPVPALAGVAQWRRMIDESSCSAVFLERPSFFGSPTDELDALQELCRAAAARAAFVLVDESNANYAPPSFSAAPLTSRHCNLAVLRGLSKAYGLGSLRVGICISAASLTPVVRASTAPMQVASLSLHIARMLLEHGDLAAPLRQRIVHMRPRAQSALQASGARLRPSNPLLPYVLLATATPLCSPDCSDAAIRTKRHPLWTGKPELETVHRCSIPLGDDRMQRLEQGLAVAASTPPDSSSPPLTSTKESTAQ
jgi:histidinol-phosphate/aromatic aminotransferase/cobyric acid decarboxylase-like protein